MNLHTTQIYNRVGRLLERAKESGRSDDKIDVIRKRFNTHVKSCLPILERFQTQGTPKRRVAVRFQLAKTDIDRLIMPLPLTKRNGDVVKLVCLHELLELALHL